MASSTASPPEAEAGQDLSSSEVMGKDGGSESTECLRERIRVLGAGPAGATPDAAEAMPRAAGMMFVPLGIVVRQQACLWNLMLDGLEMQQQFVNMWRPRHG